MLETQRKLKSVFETFSKSYGTHGKAANIADSDLVCVIECYDSGEEEEHKCRVYASICEGLGRTPMQLPQMSFHYYRPLDAGVVHPYKGLVLVAEHFANPPKIAQQKTKWAILKDVDTGPQKCDTLDVFTGKIATQGKKQHVIRVFVHKTIWNGMGGYDTIRVDGIKESTTTSYPSDKMGVRHVSNILFYGKL